MPSVQHRRGFLWLLIAVSALVSFSFVWQFRNQANGVRSPAGSLPVDDALDLSPETLHGGTIAAKLGNETVKAELGRAAWKVLHTTMARFPDKPQPDESRALRSYIHLFARLYPCGECATHFRQIITQFPPQVSSRSTAAAWACHVHNEVNRSLRKEIFDCSKIGDFYDCGCAEDEEKEGMAMAKTPVDADPPRAREAERLSAAASAKAKALTDSAPPKLKQEGLTKGG
ncbi:MAG: hypothetical protein M1826_007384 [Phylliscum demangeonii]|nr:MAG: hypothetical protein M1826_007384 [Phylliscum demangeonii]